MGETNTPETSFAKLCRLVFPRTGGSPWSKMTDKEYAEYVEKWSAAR